MFKNKVGKKSRYFVGDFNKTIIPLAFVGYVRDDYSQLGATRLVDYLASHIQRALVEILLIIQDSAKMP